MTDDRKAIFAVIFADVIQLLDRERVFEHIPRHIECDTPDQRRMLDAALRSPHSNFPVIYDDTA